MAWYKAKKGNSGPTWATATDAEIAELLQQHYAGQIDLHSMPGWEIGAERTVHLSKMSATGVSESHAAQDVTFVLMNAGGRSYSSNQEVAFIVGMKDCLKTGGYMNSPATNYDGWGGSARRTWCNSVFYNALPSSFRRLFKQFSNYYGVGGGATSGTSICFDYFALPAEIEVTGNRSWSVSGEGTQFKYYENADNRIKKSNNNNSTYWTRSASYGSNNAFAVITNQADSGSTVANATFCGISPFGCI